MKQYVSRRRRCWTLLNQMDPVMHLSEGQRSDMLLDLKGLTREERFMVQASINNERDFDRVADALIIHRQWHVQGSSCWVLHLAMSFLPWLVRPRCSASWPV